MKRRKTIDSACVLDILQGVPWWKRLWNRLARRWKKDKTVRAPIPIKFGPPLPGVPLRTPTVSRPATTLKPPSGQVQTVEQVLREDASLRRRFGPIDPQNVPVPEFGLPGIWQLDRRDGDPATGPILLAHNVVSKQHAVVLHSSAGWLFWTGPRDKMFTALGEKPVWTTTNRAIALVTANFLYASGNAHFSTVKK